MALYCSESTFAAANNLVDTVGAVNLAIGSYREVKKFLILGRLAACGDAREPSFSLISGVDSLMERPVTY